VREVRAHTDILRPSLFRLDPQGKAGYLVTDEAHPAVVAENYYLRQQMAELIGRLEAALQRSAALETHVSELEVKKTPPPSFLKAHLPAQLPKLQSKRTPEHNFGQQWEAPTQMVAHALTYCPVCRDAVSGVHAAAISPPAALTASQQVQVAAQPRDEVAAPQATFAARRDHPCRALTWWLWPFQRDLLTCVLQPEVPADNNLAERTIPPQVIARKISGGMRSPRGSETHMCLASPAASASACDLSPLAEFCYLLQYASSQICTDSMTLVGGRQK
jgi:hypothetical protein